MIRKSIIVQSQFESNLSCPYGYIYRTTNLINNKKYIGQHTKSEFDRNYYGSGKTLLKAIKKYDKKNFIVEPIDWAKCDEELNQKEMYWIEMFDAVESEDYYNIAIGGEGVKNHTWSEDERKHLSYMRNKWYETHEHPQKGTHISQERKDNLSIALMGNSNNPNMKGNLNPNLTGERWNENSKIEHSQKIKQLHKNGNYVGVAPKGSKHPRARPVVQLLDDEVIRIYSYQSEADKYGFNHTCINDCCKGIQHKHKDYVWMYLEDYNEIHPDNILTI